MRGTEIRLAMNDQPWTPSRSNVTSEARSASHVSRDLISEARSASQFSPIIVKSTPPPQKSPRGELWPASTPWRAQSGPVRSRTTIRSRPTTISRRAPRSERSHRTISRIDQKSAVRGHGKGCARGRPAARSGFSTRMREQRINSQNKISLAATHPKKKAQLQPSKPRPQYSNPSTRSSATKTCKNFRCASAVPVRSYVTLNCRPSRCTLRLPRLRPQPAMTSSKAA
jgi:hypothetical protein